MVYDDVINNSWHKILPQKKKYTKRDIDKVMTESLFNSNLNNGNTFNAKQARFIVLCTAIHHEADCSRTVHKAIYA
jgi:hypothetical protein